MSESGGSPLVTLGELLGKVGVESKRTVVMRHRPTESVLKKALPWLAAEDPDAYNAYQSQHGPTVEKALTKSAYVASLIGHEPGRALFIGVYSVAGWRQITREDFYAIEGNRVLDRLGMDVLEEGRDPLWFDLLPTEHLESWKGRLVINWPPPERSWWRWADRNVFGVHAIHEESLLAPERPDPSTLSLTWAELKVLPTSWRHALAEWRGIYYIFDRVHQLGYVGSAYGTENLLGRWTNYGATGHGGNRLLRGRNPDNFIFSVIQLVARDLPMEQVIPLETSWKLRLNTRAPLGLNDN